MGNGFVNAFVALEPSSGQDGFQTRAVSRKPAAFFVSRAGVNRLFRSNLAVPSHEETHECESSEAASFVVDQFVKRPKLA
ncbi:MAG: hypothetical protein IT572_04610 [Deltaproteobacteria bacterium]|nr:hypothetical protein [Deltaproteobacteria bacterium]